jgi:hypothetical protein
LRRLFRRIMRVVYRWHGRRRPIAPLFDPRGDARKYASS